MSSGGGGGRWLLMAAAAPQSMLLAGSVFLVNGALHGGTEDAPPLLPTDVEPPGKVQVSTLRTILVACLSARCCCYS